MHGPAAGKAAVAPHDTPLPARHPAARTTPRCARTIWRSGVTVDPITTDSLGARRTTLHTRPAGRRAHDERDRAVNTRTRRAAKARRHVPNESAAMKRVYMTIMSLDPTGKGQARWTTRGKTTLNAFGIRPVLAESGHGHPL
ncbi:hypothetical protein GCM10010214_61850 [Streptomyces abikoensis]|nr:hypothetical protein GCM10010214_61850 [Streptomyces abikoensis]